MADSGSVGLGKDLRLCISNSSPVDADSAGPKTTMTNKDRTRGDLHLTGVWGGSYFFDCGRK